MYNFDYKKNLGQNFLKDRNVINRIIDSVKFEDSNLVIEIGPGAGALTKELLKKVDNAVLYEIDTRLDNILSKELEDFDNYELIFKDFLEADIRDDLKKYSYKHLYVVANLPYYITTPIINKIIKSNLEVDEIIIMIQKEVADRLCAKPGNKEYGQITVFLNYFFEIEKIMDVSKKCFVPVPNVDSAVIKMKRKNNREKLKDLDFFEKLVKDSFKFKRKTIKNNLSNYDLEVVERVLNKYGFGLDVRSENLLYNIFVELSNELL